MQSLSVDLKNLTEAEFAAIKQREANASAGPWRAEYTANNAGMALGAFFIPKHNSGKSVEMLADDAEFIAKAREDVPKLIHNVEHLQRRLGAISSAYFDLLGRSSPEVLAEHETPLKSVKQEEDGTFAIEIDTGTPVAREADSSLAAFDQEMFEEEGGG